MKRAALTAAAVLVSVMSAQAALTPGEVARLAAAGKVLQEVHSTIPQEYLDRARCVAVIPDLKKAAFVFGGEYGKGAMSCRAGTSWSAPIFLQLAKGSWGFQVGAEQVDVVLLVMNESGVQKLLQNKVTLGADASVAAGPLGRKGEIATDATLKAEMLSYSKAQGLFAGIDLSGGILRPDEDANRNAYGLSASPKTILASREISAPTEATAFLNALANVAPAVVTAAPSPATPPVLTSRPAGAGSSTTDEADIRARVIEMQRTLDRLIGDAAQPVGTTGTTGGTVERSGTVIVDRTHLTQLRRQIEDLLTALDRRR